MIAMNPITACELALMRADVTNAVCDQSCVIQRASRTINAQGGASVTWSTISPDGLLVGMAEPTAGQLQNYGYLVASLAAWRVQFSYGTDVMHGDRLLINGQTLTVQVDLSPQSYNTLTTVLATEVK
jgi:hypothetical protein